MRLLLEPEATSTTAADSFRRRTSILCHSFSPDLVIRAAKISPPHSLASGRLLACTPSASFLPDERLTRGTGTHLTHRKGELLILLQREKESASSCQSLCVCSRCSDQEPTSFSSSSVASFFCRGLVCLSSTGHTFLTVIGITFRSNCQSVPRLLLQ